MDLNRVLTVIRVAIRRNRWPPWASRVASNGREAGRAFCRRRSCRYGQVRLRRSRRDSRRNACMTRRASRNERALCLRLHFRRIEIFAPERHKAKSIFSKVIVERNRRAEARDVQPYREFLHARLRARFDACRPSARERHALRARHRLKRVSVAHARAGTPPPPPRLVDLG